MSLTLVGARLSICTLKVVMTNVCVGLLCDLLWADPEKDLVGWGDSDRGVSWTFGADVVEKFLKRLELDLICRAHQVYSLGGCCWFCRVVFTPPRCL